MARLSSAAPTGELLALGGRYRTLHDKQYNLEADSFMNPGEELARTSDAEC